MATNPTQLPIEPQITPAFAVGGALLVFSGLGYLIFGIKSKRLNVFFSSGYLVSLAVTVLIISIANPPVSNAIQGAYLVAIVISGAILGAASLLISDTTEGFGCLLGGFCMTMWILGLKPGGLIGDPVSKDVFIAVLTVAAFTLFFSRWTKDYALVGLTSFAGATVIILGVDCFSRAGLKEFWLYIWTLNPNFFPPTTSTYPITRGMRAQIALIFVLFVIGLIAQSKAWKAIRKRREEHRNRLLEVEDQRDREEENLGRRLEEGNDRERVYWEAAYGERRRGLDRGMNAENLTRSHPARNIRIGDSEPPAQSMELAPLNISEDRAWDTLRGIASKSASQGASTMALISTPLAIPISQRESIPERPRAEASSNEVTRNPPIPHDSTSSESVDDKTGIDNRTQPIAEHVNLSGRSLNKLSLKPTSTKPSAASWRAALESDEASPISEADIRSSSSPLATAAIDDDICNASALGGVADINNHPEVPEVFGEPSRFTSCSDTKKSDVPKRLGSDPKDTTTLKEWLGHSRSRTPSEIMKNDPIAASKVPRAPSQTPKVTIVRQPNQPAESTSFAEKTHDDVVRAASIAQDDTRESEEPTVSNMNYEHRHENTRPQAQQHNFATTTNAMSHPAKTSHFKSHGPSRSTLNHQRSFHTFASAKDSANCHCFSASGPLPSPALVTQEHHDNDPQYFGQLQGGYAVDEGLEAQYSCPPASVRHFSYPGRPMLSPRLSRAKSSPSIRSTSNSSSASSTYSYDTICSSRSLNPRALSRPSTASVRNFSYPSPPASMRHESCPGPSMLVSRNTQIKRYPSSQHITRSHPGSSICFSDTSFLHQGLSSDVDDTMPLSTRRAIIQSQRRAASYDIPRLSSNNLQFDSHQPQQLSSYNPRKHDAMLAEWRESLRWDQATGSNPRDTRVAPDRGRGRRSPGQKLEWKQKSLMEKYRDEVMERAMMNGELEDVHREAMRRMQALANIRA